MPPRPPLRPAGAPEGRTWLSSLGWASPERLELTGRCPACPRRSAAVQGVPELLLAFLAQGRREHGAAVLTQRVDNPVRGDLVHHEEQGRRAGLQQVAHLVLKI